MSKRDIATMQERQRQVVADARKILDEIADDAADDVRQEAEGKHDAAMEEYKSLQANIDREQRVIDAEEKLKKREEQRAETERDRNPDGDDFDDPERETDSERANLVYNSREYRSALMNYCRGGTAYLTPEESQFLVRGHRMMDTSDDSRQRETRALTVGTGGSGGFLIPDEMMRDLIVKMKKYGPMNDDAFMMPWETDGGADLPVPIADPTAQEAVDVAEGAAITEKEPTFTQIVLKAYKKGALMKVNNELFQDGLLSDTQLDMFLRRVMAEFLGRKTNKDWTVGSTANNVEGIVAGSTEGITTASNSTITGDEIKNLMHEIDPAYLEEDISKICFQMNWATVLLIRKLKDGDGNYLWDEKDMRKMTPNMLLGYEVKVNQAMESFGSNNRKPILFGNHDYYIKRRVRSIAIRRLDERYADSDQTGFTILSRIDGKVKVNDALKHVASS